ncbi:hypothetical protein GGI04_003130, partial [Coemansia thaxteri]
MALAALFSASVAGSKHALLPMLSSASAQVVRSMATQENMFSTHRFTNAISSCASAMLIVIAADKCAGWEGVLGLLVVVAVPLLALHSSAYTAFQCLNAFGIYRAVDSPDDWWRAATCALMHLCLALSNLDMRSQRQLGSVVLKLTYSQERQLLALRRLRELKIGDVWQLPERYSLRNSYREFKYNTDERLFLIRAILRMMWRPMIPVYIAESLLKTVVVLKTTLSSTILHCLDSPDAGVWYKGYLVAILIFLTKIVKVQMNCVRSYSTAETSRVTGAVELELLRLPLSKSGNRPRGSTYTNRYYIFRLLGDIRNVQGVVSSLFGTAATIWITYSRVGWFAFVPICVSMAFNAVEWCIVQATGQRHVWSDGEDYDSYDGKIDEVCHGIKAIKLFGWERMYLDPRLQQETRSKKKLPWYAPAVRSAWFVFDNLETMSGELSTFLTIYLHLQTVSTGMLSNADLFELSAHGDHMRRSINGVVFGIRRIGSIIRSNRELERALRGHFISSLPRTELVEAQPSVGMESCSFKWRKRRLVLKSVTLSLGGGELVAVVGKTASGKSSLLLAMCSEVEMTAGSGLVRGTVSYLEQQPWIMNDTMRANILFGRAFDEDRYWKAVSACALTEDLEAWVERDMTVIGERGVNLSGGQRARLALARTVYSQADIYILDDPLSAVDAVVKRHILDNVILGSGILGDKLRIVATHAEGILPFCNQVVTVDKGNVSAVSQVPRKYIRAPAVAAVVGPAVSETDSDSDGSSTVVDGKSEARSSDAADASTDGEAQAKATPDVPSSGDDDGDEDGEKKPVRKWSNRENAVYIIRMCGLPVLASMVFSGIFGPISEFILDGYKLDALRSNSQAAVGALGGSGAVLSYLKMHMFSRIARSLVHRFESFVKDTIDRKYLNDDIKIAFVRSVIYAPLSFFDSTSRHHISTAYNDGADVVSGGIPRFLMSEVSMALETGLSIYRIASTAPQLLVISPLIAWAVVKRDRLMDPAAESLRVISRAGRVRHSRAKDVIEGGQRIIRLFGVEQHFTAQHMECIDEKARLNQPINALGTLGSLVYKLILDVGDVVTTFSMLLQSQTTMYKISSGELVTCKRLMGTLIGNINSVVNLPSRVLQFSDNIDLYRQYTNLTPEASYVVDECRPPSSWPQHGGIEMRDFTLKYAEHLKPALNKINLSIRPGEKIGIVGRTGAGKSTLVKALFRLQSHENNSGSIAIDGQDIAQIGLADLRPRLGVIPQESTMFSGTIGQNLDPLQEFSVEDMWAAMIRCNIAKLVAARQLGKSNDSSTATTGNDADGDDDDDDDSDDDDEEEAEKKERWDRSGILMRLVLM